MSHARSARAALLRLVGVVALFSVGCATSRPALDLVVQPTDPSLGPTGAVILRCVDGDGEAIAEAIVTVSPGRQGEPAPSGATRWSGRTDRDGRVRIDGLPSLRFLHWSCLDEVRGPSSPEDLPLLGAGEVRDLGTVPVQPARPWTPVRGRITDADGNPVPGAIVGRRSSANPFLPTVTRRVPSPDRCRTDADGRYSLPYLALTERSVLEVVHPAFAPRWSTPIDPRPAEWTERDLVLREGATRTVHAVDAFGEGIAGVELWDVPADELVSLAEFEGVRFPDEFRPRATGDVAGRIRLEGLGERERTHWCVRAGSTCISIEASPSAENFPGRVRFPPAGDLEIVVKDAEGTPVHGARVEVEDLRLASAEKDRDHTTDLEPPSIEVLPGWTDAMGRVVMERVPAGECRVSLHGPRGALRGQRATIEAGETRLSVIVLDPEAPADRSVAVEVLDPRRGPAADFPVHWTTRDRWAEGGRRTGTVRTDASGIARFWAPGDSAVEVRLGGVEWGEARLRIPAFEVRARHVLRARSRLVITALDHRGHPVEDLGVTVTPVEGELPVGRAARTEGGWLVTGLPAGHHLVEVETRSGWSASRAVDLSDPEGERVRFDVPPPIPVTFVFHLAADRVPRARARVRGVGGVREVPLEVVRTEDGLELRGETTFPAPGSATVHLTGDAYAREELDLVGPIVHEIEVPWFPVRVRFLDAAAGPLANARVVWHRRGEEWLDAEGCILHWFPEGGAYRYELPDTPDGRCFPEVVAIDGAASSPVIREERTRTLTIERTDLVTSGRHLETYVTETIAGRPRQWGSFLGRGGTIEVRESAQVLHLRCGIFSATIALEAGKDTYSVSLEKAGSGPRR